MPLPTRLPEAAVGMMRRPDLMMAATAPEVRAAAQTVCRKLCLLYDWGITRERERERERDKMSECCLMC
jgi:hypothetical protein